MPAFFNLPAFNVNSRIDFSPINSALDDIKEDREKNKLLLDAREIGAAIQQPQNALMSGAQGSAGAAGREYSPYASPASPAQASFAASGRDYPTDNRYGNAIAGIETPGHKAPYQAVGPATRTGDRAYGKFQVMGANVGPWTQEILGRRMTPEEFQASPDAQEAVFKGKFGQYVQKTGNPQDAASMWFTGRPASEGANRRASTPDGRPLGITGSEYVAKFNAGLQGGGQQPSAAYGAPEASRAPSGPNYRAAAAMAYSKGQIAQGNQFMALQQQADEQTYNRQRQGRQDIRQERQDDQTAELNDMKLTEARDELQTKFAQRVGSIAQVIASEPDAGKKSAMLQRFLGADPRIAAGLQKYGVDASDADAVTRYLIAEARGLQGGKKYEFTKYGVGDPSTGQITPYPNGAGSEETVVERAKLEQQLRKEWSTLTGDNKTINDSVARVKTGASLDSGTGDLAIVYGYMKLLDPGSVVREGEFATAEQTAGLPQQIVGLYNKVINGERLTPAQRQQFVSAADGLAGDKMKRFEGTRRQFETIARKAGADPSRIMLDEGRAAPAPDTINPTDIAPEAIKMLRGDPSPEAQSEFDAIFGAGSARRALGR